MKKILVIDNYDSFVYNLVNYLEEFDCQVTVKRNDQFQLDECKAYDKILLSPGPGVPDEAGLLKNVIREYGSSKPILGVCLGQQAIGEVFGGSIINLDKVFHGVTTTITIQKENTVLFKDLETQQEVGRYHSWVVSRENLPECLEITAIDENNQIMALQHKTLDICAVQFHPESVLTPNGKTMIKNWVNH